MNTFYITCAPGLESLLKEEIEEILSLASTNIQSGLGMVAFKVPESEQDKALATVCAFSRVGARVLMPLRSFSSANLAMLYDQVRRIPWPDIFPNTESFAVFSHGNLGVPGIAASILPLKIKDAICDEFRKWGLDRPNVDRKEPDVRLEAHFTKGRCEISIELTPYPLHRRGYRNPGQGGGAPIREDKAAALLRFAGLETDKVWVDAFCGSGTLAIEAARQRLGFANSVISSQEINKSVLVKFYPGVKDCFKEFSSVKPASWVGPKIKAYDVNENVLNIAKENARRARVADYIEFEKKDATTLEGENLQIFGNPPYGERLGVERKSAELISKFTRQLKHHASPCELTLVLPKGDLEKAPGLKPSSKIDFENATLPSRLLKYKLFKGARRFSV